MLEVIQKRQSVRAYQSQPVENEKITQCLEAARLAPSACNAQAWHFVVIDEPELKNAVAECSASLGMNKFLTQSPVIVAIILEKPNFMSKVGTFVKRKDYTLIDIGIAAEHFCLQATTLGLGTCIVGWFNEKKTKKLLHIPQRKRVPLLISVGYSADNQRDKNRKSLEEIVSYNKY
ncbi:MAG: nitroreductase family protein [Bacteroidales bacterium]|jgi:nitroreductase|nr:nitroreductase family protein [Bacteroidales bacterium]